MTAPTFRSRGSPAFARTTSGLRALNQLEKQIIRIAYDCDPERSHVDGFPTDRHDCRSACLECLQQRVDVRHHDLKHGHPGILKAHADRFAIDILELDEPD